MLEFGERLAQLFNNKSLRQTKSKWKFRNEIVVHLLRFFKPNLVRSWLTVFFIDYHENIWFKLYHFQEKRVIPNYLSSRIIPQSPTISIINFMRYLNLRSSYECFKFKYLFKDQQDQEIDKGYIQNRRVKVKKYFLGATSYIT